LIVLFGGAAGVGKTTIARLWCQSRNKAVHIQLDEIRNLIVSGLADPQILTAYQGTQYSHSVAACTSLARSFAGFGYDVAIDDVFEPEPTRGLWLPQLDGLDVHLVILHPPLEIVLTRIADRKKQVLEHHIRSQHAVMNGWPSSYIINSGPLNPRETLEHVIMLLERLVEERPDADITGSTYQRKYLNS
jgi:predicted kinase